MFTRIRYGGDGLPYNFSEFLCDTAEDISSLPKNTSGEKVRCSYGSVAFVIGSKKKYILGNDNNWVELQSSGGGGSSGDISNYLATTSEVIGYIYG